jgi:predicted DNA-binding transcriptional regulator AlpA
MQTQATNRVEALLIPDTAAAQLAGVSRAHLHRMRAAGKWGPKAIRLGRKLLFSRDETIQWINAACPDGRTWEAMQASAARRLRVS